MMCMHSVSVLCASFQNASHDEWDQSRHQERHDTWGIPHPCWGQCVCKCLCVCVCMCVSLCVQSLVYVYICLSATVLSCVFVCVCTVFVSCLCAVIRVHLHHVCLSSLCCHVYVGVCAACLSSFSVLSCVHIVSASCLCLVPLISPHARKDTHAVCGTNLCRLTVWWQTPLHLDNQVLYRDANFFPDPYTYMPERWLRDWDGQKPHPFIVLPFGHGPRMCAGQ